MKTISKTAACLVIAASAPLVSCATLRNVGKGSVAVVRKSTTATVSTLASIPKPRLPKMPDMPDFSIANLLPGKRIKVVEVREKDLKEMPTGTELAQAYQRERRSGFWIFGGPVDFKEPSLPESGSEMDGSLLPPRMP
jgi:hypothetical protein